MTDTKPRLSITRKVPDAVTARALRDYDCLLNEDDTLLDADALVERAGGRDALLVSPTERMTAEVIARLPESVQIIATFSVGYEHIDLGAAKARGLRVTNTPDVLTDATADITFLLILAAARRAHEGERMVREDRWKGWKITEMLGVHVTGKRLGILGMGRIGQAVARRARGFDMDVHYSNRRRLPADLEAGATFHGDPHELLMVSDILSIHCPASPETHHFLNRERIGLLPANAILVNTARGTVVDDEALIEAARSGRVAAIGLDVFEGEPNINPAYRDLPNAFLLPHLGSATVETRDAMGLKCLDNMDAHFAGREPPDRLA